MTPLLKFLLAAIPIAATSSLVTANLIEIDQEPVATQEPVAPGADADMQAMMAKMMELATPGKEHKELAEAAGKWNTKIRYRFSADAPWESATGTAKIQSALGGRFMVEQSTFNMMGMETKGMLVLGYDNLTKKYQALWCDSMGTGMYYSEGVKNADGAMELQGLIRDAITPKGRPFRHVTTVRTKDHVRVEMYDAIPAEPGQPTPKEATTKVMEIEYIRG